MSEHPAESKVSASGERFFPVTEDDPDSFLKKYCARNRNTAILLFSIFIFAGLLVYYISGSAADPIVVEFVRTDAPEVRARFQVIATGLDGVTNKFDAPAGTFRLKKTYVSSLVANISEKVREVPVTLSVSVGRNSRNIPLEPSDYVPHDFLPETVCLDLTPHLAPDVHEKDVFQGLFPRSIVNRPTLSHSLLRFLFWWPLSLLLPLAFVVAEELGHRDLRSRLRRRFACQAVGTVSLTLLSGLFVFLLAKHVFYVDPADHIEQTLSTYFFPRVLLDPDTGQLKSYAVFLLSIPVFLPLSYVVTRRIVRATAESGRTIEAVYVVCMIAGIVVPLTVSDVLMHRFFRGFPPVRLFFAVSIAVGFVLLALYRRKSFFRFAVPIGVGVIAFFFVTVFLIRLHGESFVPEPHHFDCVYYSVAQTMAGKTPLIDFQSMYGGFALLLEPALRLTGYDIFPFALVMSALSTLSLIFLVSALRLSVKNPAVLTFGTFYLVFYVYVFQYFSYHSEYNDLFYRQQAYLMRFPIRTLFLYGSAFFMLRYFSRRSTVDYVLVFLSVFSAPVWNFDTGIILPIVWFAVLVQDELLGANQRNTETRKRTAVFVRIARHAALFAVVGTATLVLFCVYLHWRSGQWLDFQEMFDIQRGRALIGFYARQMNTYRVALPCWTIYCAGLFYALHCVVTRRNCFTARTALIFSLLGFGLFPYYMNRAWPMNSFMVSFPAVMLGIVWLDRVKERFDRESPVRRHSVLGLLYVLLWSALLFGVAVSLLRLPSHFEAVRVNLGLLSGVGPDYRPLAVEIKKTHSANEDRQNLALLKRHVRPGDEVLILCNNYEAYYYGMTKTKSAVDLPSSVEWGRWSEIETVKKFLVENMTVDVFAEPDNLPPGVFSEKATREILDTLNEYYDPYESSSPDNPFSLYRRKKPVGK